MKKFKIFFLSAFIALVIVMIPVLLIIIPINEKQDYLDKEEKIIKKAEKKLKAVEGAVAENARNIGLLQTSLLEKPILSFLEEKLSASRLSIESVKPSQDDEIHVVLKGEYRDLLNFIFQLSKQENSVVVKNLSIEENRIEIDFKNMDEKRVIEKAKHHATLLKRLASALDLIKVPEFSLMSRLKLSDVQSPFVPRVLPAKDEGPFQSLAGVDWHLSGEVRQHNCLLGVFLEMSNHAQSHYFGVGLPWENSDWRVLTITQNTIIFERLQQHTHWTLFYQH